MPLSVTGREAVVVPVLSYRVKAARPGAPSDMDPLLIFSLIFGWFILAGIGLYVYRHVITRVCPQCDARVELGRTRAQVCGYRFSTARY
jgi:hypothetical protein